MSNEIPDEPLIESPSASTELSPSLATAPLALSGHSSANPPPIPPASSKTEAINTMDGNLLRPLIVGILCLNVLFWICMLSPAVFLILNLLVLLVVLLYAAPYHVSVTFRREAK